MNATNLTYYMYNFPYEQIPWRRMFVVLCEKGCVVKSLLRQSWRFSSYWLSTYTRKLLCGENCGNRKCFFLVLPVFSSAVAKQTWLSPSLSIYSRTDKQYFPFIKSYFRRLCEKAVSSKNPIGLSAGSLSFAFIYWRAKCLQQTSAGSEKSCHFNSHVIWKPSAWFISQLCHPTIR